MGKKKRATLLKCLTLIFIGQVDKDDFVLRAHVRSERREVLEKMLDLPMMLTVKMSTPLTLDTYTSFAK